MKRLRFFGARGFGAALLLTGTAALADDPTPSPATSGEPSSTGKTWSSCVEHLPTGATRPDLQETFPERGLSGHAARLTVTVKHGKGETVLPSGFKIQSASDASRGLSLAGFVLPDVNGGSAPSLERIESESGVTTTLSIPFVPLPKEAGRNGMVLPPVPIAVSRASGELITLCTKPHPIVVEDPTANESDPKVRLNPPGRSQREEWELAKNVTIGAAIGAALMAILAWLFIRWRKTPKVIKLPPPKLPWVIALEELDAIASSNLLVSDAEKVNRAEKEAERVEKEAEKGAARTKTGARTQSASKVPETPVDPNAEYFDRVSDTVRKYLGARYGFDGLETTTDEMRSFLKRVRPQIPNLVEITNFLEDCDLVKFARVVPAEEDCKETLSRGYGIVHRTIPEATANAPRSASEGRNSPKDKEAA